MKPRPISLSIALCLCLSLCLSPAAAAQTDPATELYQLINQVRLNAGLTPLAKSTLLQQAAQRHADDLMQKGTAIHAGSDGSNYQQRIREAGYRAWNDGLLVNEAIWLGLGSPSDAAKWLLSDPEAHAMFLEQPYREMGVGYAADDQGIHYLVVTFGARPGVLPIFINDGNDVTDSPQIAVRLTNEQAEPFGEGTWIGKAIEVRLNNSPDFTGVTWQPWEPLLPWMLADTTPGDYAIYVEFRDGANRTTISEAVVRLVVPGEAPPTPTPPGDLGLPLGTLTPTPDDTPVSATPTPTPPVSHAPESTPTVSGTLQATWTPLPSALDEDETAPAANTRWPITLALALQGVALLLGIAAFLRRK